MKLEPNMYVRTKRGTFDRFMTSKKIESLTWYTFEDRGSITNPENYIIKASHNIIDLIEEGDYVNGELVIALRKDIKSERSIHMNSKDNLIFTDYDIENNWYYGIDTENIKSIVTKEQFESMEYRLGDE